MDCVFCQLVRGEVPGHVLWEDASHLAFLSIFPNTPGVTVVIPKQHHPSYAFAVEDSVLLDLTQAAKQVALCLDKALDGVARTAMVFEGYGVDHLHAKLFPLHGTGDSSAFRRISSSVDKFFHRYEGYVSSHDHQRADDKALAALARTIRQRSSVP
ncbi:MAG: HIT family protein [Paucimonas sp.]|jgi:diadenosine tetraphosphate (Ap4A) HIT family hydrolase|uniref:HIT family protein n=1 Tax=Pantoea sp. Cy-639 TaxID=2608360 RepID=UPI00141E6DC0|nr:HIT family protein [Pantoea sp. Cy-639]MDR2305919.1 HIT family protein [Paucimonas sp.]NIF16582.1 HIT family protein [Pantoea sp. Cy-639]